MHDTLTSEVEKAIRDCTRPDLCDFLLEELRPILARYDRPAPVEPEAWAVEAETDLLKSAKLCGGGDLYIDEYGRTCHCPFSNRKGGVTRKQMMNSSNHSTCCNMMWDAIARAERGMK